MSSRIRKHMPRIYDAWLVALAAVFWFWVAGYSWKYITFGLVFTGFLYGWASVYDPEKNPADNYLSDHDLETMPEAKLRSMGVEQSKIDKAKGKVPEVK